MQDDIATTYLKCFESEKLMYLYQMLKTDELRCYPDAIR